jgi:murein L,D-transpeptidase YcbB/YkuD
VALFVSAPTALQARPPQHGIASEALEGRIDQLRESGTVLVAGEVVRSQALTLAVYERLGFAPLWTSEGARRSLLLAIASMYDDGLDPEDYHLSALRGAGATPLDDASEADLDILRTDAFVRARQDLRFGKADARWSLGIHERDGPERDEDAVAEIVRIVTSARVHEALTDLRPRRPQYDALKKALVELRKIRTDGGWGVIPPGPPMRAGDWDERVPVLRRRLSLEGDLAGATGATSDLDPLFGPDLEDAVRAFQRRHGLAGTGVVQETTLAALNESVEQRIDRVRVNLERLRWVGDHLPYSFVEVNIASAMLRVFAGDSVVYETRAIVGARTTPTPVFAADILHITLNPTWTVPPGIEEEVLAAVREDPGYLESHSMRLIDTDGREVDAAGIDFSRYSAADFPYRFRQDSGPTNPLGRVKLIMPNPYYVYLHDTPARDLFAREQRLLSHGCVRIEDPLGLAERVLSQAEVWNRATLDSAIATERTTTIALPHPVPIFVLYWTAAAGPDGKPRYHPDVYGRDAGVLRALDADTEGTGEGDTR